MRVNKRSMETYPLLGFEDPISSWTHLLGAVVVIAFLLKLFKAGGIGKRHPFPVLIYGFSCIFLFSMSGVYHLLPRDITARYVLRVLDHAGIFMLISGTLIALHLILFSGLMKWGVIAVASVIAALGITFGSIYFEDIPDTMYYAAYLTFGWLGLVSIIGIWKLKRTLSLKYLVYGGLAYTFGAIMDWARYPVIVSGLLGPHEMFHFAVLLGVTFHWMLLLEAIKTVDPKKAVISKF